MSKLTDEQHRMAGYLGLSHDCNDPYWLNMIDYLIRLRAKEGDDAVARKVGEMFSEPAPTLRDVMRELDELKRMVARLQTAKL